MKTYTCGAAPTRIDRDEPFKAGFQWDSERKRWATPSRYIAYNMQFQGHTSDFHGCSTIDFNLGRSAAEQPVVPIPGDYYPFQAAGIEHMADQLRRRSAVLCADEQGLGKTIQAIGIANELGFKKLLVICPASLRLNWKAEIEKWHVHNPGVQAMLNGRTKINSMQSVITSYNLAGKLTTYVPDLIIIDELHYLKNMEAQRTTRILGDRNSFGMVNVAPVVGLTGTPAPNGNPAELWPFLYKCAPDVIDGMRYYEFLDKYCVYFEGDYGPFIKGIRNEAELYMRLRGSGLMTRRMKADVLKDLPPKRYKMVVFPQNSKTAKIIKKEKAFDASEIILHGVPVGSPLPELRKEMGIGKVPQVSEYVRDLLQGGASKAVVFAHHREPIRLLANELSEYNPVVITGSTPARERQRSVEAFQKDPSVRLFIGNEAAEEGITLTAAADVVLAEPEWVPGKNAQRIDRLHRIGQRESVLVHILVVEESLDSQILSKAAVKSEWSESFLN